MSVIIEIKGESKYSIKIELFYYLYPDNVDGTDNEWINCNAKFEGSFKCGTNLLLLDEDLARFYNSLNDLLNTLDKNKKVVFNTLEDQIMFEIILSSVGTVTINGYLENDSRNEKVEFTFDSDQSYLQNTLKQIKKAIDKFPGR